MRQVYLDSACGGDTELRSEIERLLRADRDAGTFIDSPALGMLGSSTFDFDIKWLNPGQLIAERYEIRRFLGQGGMGQVYEAYDRELEERVALKAIRPEIATNPRMISRFRREVQLTRRITHPNVCRTFDISRVVLDLRVDRSIEIAFLTMELLEGETLSELLLRRGALKTSEAGPLVHQIVGALGAAHAVGVVHRDLKPSNILLVPSNDGYRAVITDFGLARCFGRGSSFKGSLAASVTGESWMGTLIYMAPEQLESGETTPRTDIYALGLIMYEMITGKRPFDDPVPLAEATKRLKQSPPSPKSIISDLSASWETTIIKCLAALPIERFASAAQLAESLEEHSHLMSSGVTRSSRRTAGPTGNVREKLAQKKWLFLATILIGVSLSIIILRHSIRRTPKMQFAERDWILVTDFTNLTGERVFDRVLRDLVVQSLSQSSYLNVVPRSVELDQLAPENVGTIQPVDEAHGREICLRGNCQAVLSGEIQKKTNQYIISIKVQAPRSPNGVISENVEIQSQNEVFAGVDRLVARVRKDLGEPSERIKKSTTELAHVTTPSLEALQRYSAASDLYGAREYLRCINLAQDAVELDPRFAMAHLLLASSYEQMGNEAQFKNELRLANANSDRVSEREKHLILAATYASQMLNERASQEYQHVLDIFPDDIDALKGFSNEAYWAGRTDESISALTQVLRLVPGDSGSYDTLMTLQVRTNRFSEALQVYQQAASHNVATTNLLFLESLAAWGEGDLPRAKESLDKLDKDGSTYWKLVSRLSEGKLLAFQGRLHEATLEFKTGLALAEMPGFENWPPAFLFQIARADLIEGNTKSAAKNTQRYGQSAEKAPIVANLGRGVSLFVAAGDLASARRFESLAVAEVSRDPDPFAEMELHSLRGEIDLAEGELGKAVVEERTALSFRSWYSPYMLLARACEAEKQWQCAIGAYREYLNFKGEILRDDVPEDWVIAHASLANAYAKMGDTSAADSLHREFSGLFSAADHDLAIPTAIN